MFLQIVPNKNRIDTNDLIIKRIPRSREDIAGFYEFKIVAFIKLE